MGDAWKVNEGVNESQSCFQAAPVSVSTPSPTQMGGAERRNFETESPVAIEYLELVISAFEMPSTSIRCPQKATVIVRVVDHLLKWMSNVAVSAYASLISYVIPRSQSPACGGEGGGPSRALQLICG
jgi:hypothetical protein